MLLRKALGQTTVDLMSYWIHFVINHELPVTVLSSHSFFTEWSHLMVNSLVPSGFNGRNLLSCVCCILDGALFRVTYDDLWAISSPFLSQTMTISTIKRDAKDAEAAF